MKKLIFLVIVTVTLVFISFRGEHILRNKPIGIWEGQVITSPFPYNDEYAISVMVDGKLVILTNQLEDMFDIPKTNVKFSGTIESLNPLVIHVNQIGY